MDRAAVREMNILLIGRSGQVGRELCRSLLPLGPLTACDRSRIDLARPAQLADALKHCQPDIVVSAGAYTAVDQAEQEPERAWRINAEAVAELADFCAARETLLVHYSTDYVHDGRSKQPYRESDPATPLNVYGRSKLAGEAAILDSGCPALILRTSWVYASIGRNFVNTMLQLATQRDRLRVVADQVGAPTSAELIADVTALAILAWRHGRLAPGLYHLTAAGETSWHGLACHAIEGALLRGAALRTQPANIEAIPAADYPAPAARPASSRLDCRTLNEALGIQLPDWRAHLDRLLDQRFGEPRE